MARLGTATRSPAPELLKLVGCVLLCQLAGGIGSLATSDSLRTWYPTLRKPSWNPPDAVFGPVWTALYALMGIALYLVLRRRMDRETRAALALFGVQLALNTLWSLLFFGRRSPGAAFAEIVLLWFAVLLTILAFRRVSVAASVLLVPYLLWVSFAAALNLAIWRLNA